jgi:hypothetical protein
MNKKPMTVQEMARMGGKARAKALTPAQRSKIAKKAVAAREAKRKAKKK